MMLVILFINALQIAWRIPDVSKMKDLHDISAKIARANELLISVINEASLVLDPDELESFKKAARLSLEGFWDMFVFLGEKDVLYLPPELRQTFSDYLNCNKTK